MSALLSGPQAVTPWMATAVAQCLESSSSSSSQRLASTKNHRHATRENTFTVVGVTRLAQFLMTLGEDGRADRWLLSDGETTMAAVISDAATTAGTAPPGVGCLVRIPAGWTVTVWHSSLTLQLPAAPVPLGGTGLARIGGRHLTDIHQQVRIRRLLTALQWDWEAVALRLEAKVTNDAAMTTTAAAKEPPPRPSPPPVAVVPLGNPAHLLGLYNGSATTATATAAAHLPSQASTTDAVQDLFGRVLAVADQARAAEAQQLQQQPDNDDEEEDALPTTITTPPWPHEEHDNDDMDPSEPIASQRDWSIANALMDDDDDDDNNVEDGGRTHDANDEDNQNGKNHDEEEPLETQLPAEEAEPEPDNNNNDDDDDDEEEEPLSTQLPVPEAEMEVDDNEDNEPEEEEDDEPLATQLPEPIQNEENNQSDDGEVDEEAFAAQVPTFPQQSKDALSAAPVTAATAPPPIPPRAPPIPPADDPLVQAASRVQSVGLLDGAALAESDDNEDAEFMTQPMTALPLHTTTTVAATSTEPLMEERAQPPPDSSLALETQPMDLPADSATAGATTTGSPSLDFSHRRGSTGGMPSPTTRTMPLRRQSLGARLESVSDLNLDETLGALPRSPKRPRRWDNVPGSHMESLLASCELWPEVPHVDNTAAGCWVGDTLWALLNEPVTFS